MPPPNPCRTYLPPLSSPFLRKQGCSFFVPRNQKSPENFERNPGAGPLESSRESHKEKTLGFRHVFAVLLDMAHQGYGRPDGDGRRRGLCAHWLPSHGIPLQGSRLFPAQGASARCPVNASRSKLVSSPFRAAHRGRFRPGLASPDISAAPSMPVVPTRSFRRRKKSGGGPRGGRPEEPRGCRRAASSRLDPLTSNEWTHVFRGENEEE